MTSISEQLSAARTSQLEAQLDWMRVFAAQAFHSAQQVTALNLDTSRAAIARSTEALRQLLSASDPRDLFTLGSQTQEQLQHMFDYGQALMRIAAGTRDDLQRIASTAPASPPVTQAVPDLATPAVTTPAVTTPPVTAPVAAPPAAAPVAVTADVVATTPAPAEPPAAASPIAKAVRRVAAKPAAAPRPVASEIAIAPKAATLPRVKPVDAAAPAKAAPASAQPPLPGIKAAKATRKTTRK